LDKSEPTRIEELKLRLALERTSDTIFLTAPDGRITYVNPAFERLYGFTSGEAIGKTARLLKSGIQDASFYERLWAKLLAKEVVAVEMINRAKDGRLVHVEASANPIIDDQGSTIGFMAIQRDITERRQMEERRRQSEDALRQSEEQYRGLFDSSPVPTWVFDTETMRFLAVNETAVRHYGYSRDEFLRMKVTEIRSAEDATRLTELARSARPGVIRYGIWRHRRKDGTAIDADITGQAFETGNRRAMIVYAQDVTAQRLLEEQFRQAQKMEAVGRLAGGVAHDFNNLLSVILSYASMTVSSLPADSPLREDIGEVERAALRAAELTGQLLAFSRRQVLQPRVVDLNESLVKMERMLRRLLGEDVELAIVGTPSLWRVKVDPGQIEQVVMNLAVNARDAMPSGGRLTIETDNVMLDDVYARAHPGTAPGPHVMMAVSDNGVGMAEATRSHIFEPFFTTKEVGRGTGLGLSTVLGIVQQSGGSIWVYSEVGKGTTFKLYFPRSEQVGEEIRHRSSGAPRLHRGETILLAEDEEQVRHLVRSILVRNGYQVLAASTPAEAIDLAERHSGQIHLLLTDLVMPGMDGRKLARRMISSRPDVKVLYVSGYTGQVLVSHGALDEGVAFLQKPITPGALLDKVREVLDLT
jgi:two-component system cell cycle sensor histidine kinase/response regulator CckA